MTGWWKRCGVAVLAFLFGVLAGFGISRITSQDATDHDVKYGIISNELETADAEWTDFPAWRQFSCEVNGSFTMRLPHQKGISIAGMEDDNALKETKRSSHLQIVDGKLTICDDVTYRIDRGYIISENLPKGLDEITDARAGYYLEAYCDAERYGLGYVFPMRQDMELWGERENRYKEQRINPYLSSLTLSDTYGMTRNDNLVLARDEDETLSCNIRNTGQEAWQFQDDLPQIEMWYRGVWLALDDGADSACMLGECAPGEEIKINIPEDTEEKYSSLINGIYRIVIKGAEKDYIISDSYEK